MKIEIGVIVDRKTGKETPIYRDVPDEQAKAMQKAWDKQWVDFFCDYVRKKEQASGNV